MDPWYQVPAPTWARVRRGTPVIGRSTVAGSGVPVAEPVGCVLLELEPALITINTTTTAITASTLAAAIRVRFRTSALRAAARWAATRSLAACCLFRSALVI